MSQNSKRFNFPTIASNSERQYLKVTNAFTILLFFGIFQRLLVFTSLVVIMMAGHFTSKKPMILLCSLNKSSITILGVLVEMLVDLTLYCVLTMDVTWSVQIIKIILIGIKIKIVMIMEGVGKPEPRVFLEIWALELIVWKIWLEPLE